MPPPPSVPSLVFNCHPRLTRSKTQTSLCLAASVFAPSLFLTTEPFIVNQAVSSPVYVHAMHEEFNALQQQCTWDLVPLPSHKVAIGCKWVYRITKNSDGSFARYKARLVAKDY